MNGLWAAAERMCGCIAEILAGCAPSIYLYGSAALDDFRPGWSDVHRLVGLRQELLAQEPDNGYYRAFEGGMRSLAAFVSGAEDRVVYWGTSGQRIARNYSFDSFCRSELLDSGRLLLGEDVRGAISRPGMDELRADVRRHCASIREYGALTGRSLYSFGWMLDISRCLYTLRTGRIIAKTAAGEWALAENLGEGCETSRGTLWALPSPERLAKCSEAELRAMGTGYRARYLIETARRVADGFPLEQLQSMDYAEAHARLLELPGVGDKVADCVLLFGCRQPSAFPVDVWVDKLLRSWFGVESKSRRAMMEEARRRFGPHGGILQQFLFHAARTGEISLDDGEQATG